jgi:hypothetical protein
MMPRGGNQLTLNRERVLKVMDIMMQCPNATQVQIAARMGIKQPTIHKYVKVIRKWWEAEDKTTCRRRRNKRVRQLQFAAEKAYASYERSRQDDIETVTSTGRCAVCNGTGMTGEEDWCQPCNGDGTVEVTRTSVRGRPGEAQFLNTYISCIKECAKLEGLYPDKTKVVNKQKNVLKVKGRYDDADAEDILAAKLALDKLKNGNGRIMEVESEEVDDG